jgi:hypothetical protein
MNIEPNRCELNLNIEDEIDSDGYYRIEVNHDKLYAPYCVGSLSNPVFVKKINGPGNGCFSFENDAKPVFDDAKKRWTMPSVIVKDVKYENNLWNISFFNPGETCLFSVNAESGLEKYQKKNTLISGKGEHEIEIVARASGAR